MVKGAFPNSALSTQAIWPTEMWPFFIHDPGPDAWICDACIYDTGSPKRGRRTLTAEIS